MRGFSEGCAWNVFLRTGPGFRVRTLPQAKACSSLQGICRRAVHATKAAPRRMKMIHLYRRGAVKELRERLEHVPPRTRGDFRGVTGNPHPVLIQQWLPPSSPPLVQGGDESENNTLLQERTN